LLIMARKSHTEVFWANHPAMPRCEAIMRNGARCPFEPLPGDVVCRRHREQRELIGERESAAAQDLQSG
jgi:hypothetical protein